MSRDACLPPDHPEVVVRLVGRDGNAFAVIAAVRRGLQSAGLLAEAEAFTNAGFDSESYDDLLRLVLSTVTVE